MSFYIAMTIVILLGFLGMALNRKRYRPGDCSYCYNTRRITAQNNKRIRIFDCPRCTL